MANGKTGLFHISYEIGGAAIGAQHVSLSLGVFTPNETVSGVAHITQSTNPPLNVVSNVEGQYTYMCVMPKNCHILITLTGHPIVTWPHGGGVGPVIMPNCEFRIVVTDDWKTGTADYKYIDAAGNWHEVKGAPVKQVVTEAINA